MRVAVRRKLPQDNPRRHRNPSVVDERTPCAIIGLVRAGRTAITFDAIHCAVAAGVAGARLLEFLIPIVALGVPLAMMTAL